MIGRLFGFFFGITLSMLALGQQCLLPGASQVPSNTQWKVGPTLYSIASANSTVASLIFAGQDAWDGTQAINRLGGWSGLISASDCPDGQSLQLGAFGFAASSCGSKIAYNATGWLGYVDYNPAACVGCGTWSMAINLDIPWSINGSPLTGQTDLGSVLTHEFGHMLGIAHHNYNLCQTTMDPEDVLYSFPCNEDPGAETMQPEIRTGPGNTCQRTLEVEDIYWMDQFY